LAFQNLDRSNPVVTADLLMKCSALAADSQTEYRADHGGIAPRQGQGMSELEGFFQADWRQLRREGATILDQPVIRKTWEAVFFGQPLQEA